MTSFDFQTCSLEAFVAEVTPQPGSLEAAASAQEILTQQLEGYLDRMVSAVCTDFQSVTFLALPDTPVSYSGQALEIVRVNAAEDALEFVPLPAGVTTFLGLTDTPGAYVADAALRVNAAGTAVEFGQSPLLDHGLLVGLADDDHLQYLLIDGSRAMTGEFDAGGFNVGNIAAAAGTGDAVEFDQAIAFFMAQGGGTFTGNVIWTDGDNAIFGTGSDSILGFDGTNTIWNLVAGLLEIQGNVRWPDNDEAQFGTAGDALLDHNGTNFIVESNAVGVGKTVFRHHALMQDNINTEYGNSGDWTIDFDGTNLVIARVIGSGFLQIPAEVRVLTMRANTVFNFNGADGLTFTTTELVASDGDEVTLTFGGGILTGQTKAPP